ncbi:hypothetical protein [Schaalia vaccimaxillae]|uniref:hypothetical protein n=1 Tax=Schaalia vaccimaxillae TaxID=183916 RepID=UPI0003B68DA0|nr:hypothetical protein [Schaalia vaccimaxillae]
MNQTNKIVLISDTLPGIATLTVSKMDAVAAVLEPLYLGNEIFCIRSHREGS